MHTNKACSQTRTQTLIASLSLRGLSHPSSHTNGLSAPYHPHHIYIHVQVGSRRGDVESLALRRPITRRAPLVPRSSSNPPNLQVGR